MFAGVALAISELPTELVERLTNRVHERGGEEEIQFLLWERERILPVWLDGQLRMVRWGTQRGQSRVLPCTAWTWMTTLESGGWAQWDAQPVVIPATMGLDHGVWYHVNQGILGIAVKDERGLPVVYVLCEPSSHYYQVMTRSVWMPVLIGPQI